MKRFSPRDTALMLAPVAVLGAFGYLLSNRKPADITPKGPFEPYISRVQVLPARPIDVFEGYDTRVIVEFDARGRKPTWWDQGFGSYSVQKQGKLVRVKKGVTTSLGRAGEFESPSLDPKIKRWVSTYRMKLHEVPPHAGQIRVRDVIIFNNRNISRSNVAAKVWLDIPLRDDGKATKMPAVSRVPGVKIEKVSLDFAPPIASQDFSERWRAKWVLLKNIPRAGAEKDLGGINVDVAVVNNRGQEVGSVGTSSYSSSEIYSDRLSYQPNTEPRRRFIHQDYALDSPKATPQKEPLWLKGILKSGDAWPLAVNIPLRDATGKMLFPPRTQTIPFQLLFVSKVAPTKEEVTEYGADSVVSVLLQAWKPGADVTKWTWETNYSQRLHTATGGIFWQMPYKGVVQDILFSYDWAPGGNILKIRYPLILASIPPSAGKVVFRTDIAANHSRRLPIELTVRP